MALTPYGPLILSNLGGASRRLDVLVLLDLERDFPTSVDEALAKAMGDDRGPAVERRALGVDAVAANSLAELLEILRVRIARRLLALPDRLGPAPVLVGLQPSAEFSCAVC